MNYFSTLFNRYLMRAGSRTIRPAALHSLLASKEFVPQAVVAADVDYFADRSGASIVKDVDDLDHFVGVGYFLDTLPFTVMHYQGHPPHTSTIYLPRQISDIDEITDIIRQITTEFKVPDNWITWQRKDNPEL